MKTAISPASVLSGSVSASRRAATLFLNRLNAIAGSALILALGWLIAASSPAFAQTATTTTLAVTSDGSAVTTVPSKTVVTLTATVQAGGTAVKPGTVNFCDALAAHCEDIHILGTAQLTAKGTATLKLRPGVGSHSYKAVFLGTKTYTGSASAAEALTVTGPSLSITAPPHVVANSTIATTVGGTGNTAPTGTVSFLDTGNGNAVLGTATLGAATAALSFVGSCFTGTVETPSSLATADFNGDGIPDLATVSYADSWYPGWVTILLGNGDGTFTVAGYPQTGMVPGSIVTADFNGDGIPDLAVTNYLDGTVTVLLGNGDGTFTAAKASPAGSYPTGILVADFNGDGIPDLVVSDSLILVRGGFIYFNSDGLRILLGHGDGTFHTAPSIPATAPGPMAAADFNGDGIPDLAVSGDGIVSILLGKGDGTFTAKTSPSTGYYPGLIAADFNGDGIPNLIVSGMGILLGNGDGTFQTAQSIPATVAGPMVVADFNGDGIPDLAMVPGDVGILLGNGDGTFAAEQVSPAACGGVYTAVAADFNGDGAPDLAVVPGDVGILLAAPQTATTPSVAGISYGTYTLAASYPGDINYAASTSVPVTLTLTPPDAATPVFAPPAGVYNSIQSVQISSTTPGATIYYTLDGSTPTTGSARYSTALTIGQTTTVNAIAVASDYSNSVMASATYTIHLPAAAAPVFTPPAGTYFSSQSVQISSTTPGAVIYYWSATTGLVQYSAPLTISNAATVIYATVLADGYSPAYSNATYTIRPAAPTFSLPSGEYLTPQSLTISDTFAGAAIYYTTDGSAPSRNATAYTGPIAIDKNMTVRATAVVSGYFASPYTSGEYGIKAPTLTFSLAGGEYLTPQSLTISAAGAKIYYTTDGSAPTAGSTPYTSAIAINNNMTIRAIAVIPGYANSPYASAQYAIKTPAPIISPGTGIYGAPQQVTITDSMAGAAIYYTTDGSRPTTGSTPYTGMITVSGNGKIRAVAAAAGYANSPLVYADYGIR